MLDPRTTDPAAPAGTDPSAEAACRAWYEAYGGPLYSYLRFHLPSPDLAEDLTAEVFLRALRSFGRFDPSRGSARAWLFRIAQNALRDHQRQARRRPVVSLAGMRDLKCDSPSPEERLLWEEEVAGLLAALEELSANDREVIGLCYGSELSMAEAGEILGLSPTATRTRLWRALARLRKTLVP
ncbi:MAG: RNA polymerase sigma factor [Gemmatimonadales bacterium]